MADSLMCGSLRLTPIIRTRLDGPDIKRAPEERSVCARAFATVAGESLALLPGCTVPSES